MKRITLYSVPNLNRVSGGPISRIRAFQKALLAESHNKAIVTNGLNKLREAIKSEFSEILYIESSTNRAKLYDFLAILILRQKCKKVVVYVRDIYFEMFPENYTGIKNRVRRYLNWISLIFFIKVSDYLAFPTIGMANKLCEFHPKLKRKNIIELPPGISDYESHDFPSLNGSRINFLYMGATAYKFSGITEYTHLSNNLTGNYRFFLLSKESLSKNNFPNITIDSIPQDQIRNFITKNNIHFLIHSRPRNDYDDLTYPIKIFDSISLNLPIISLPHPPLVKLLGSDYPLFISSLDTTTIKSLINNVISNPQIYSDIKIRYQHIADSRSYSKIINKLCQIS